MKVTRRTVMKGIATSVAAAGCEMHAAPDVNAARRAVIGPGIPEPAEMLVFDQI